MNVLNKDSPEVIKFMSLLAEVKTFCDDRPEDLAEIAASDPGVKKKCTSLSFAAFRLRKNERKSRELFAAPVDPSFLSTWRDFEQRYQKPVSDVLFSDLLQNLEFGERRKGSKADIQWENANDEASEQANGIEGVIDFAQFNIDQGYRWSDDNPELIERIEDGLAAWERLQSDTGFDLQGIFRRRELIPFILVPRHVAAKYGNADTVSMLNSLRQAHDAFVFGVPFAAIALMRSILEEVLRVHYRAEGNDLSERIRNARGRLPPGASEEALHRLRKLANAILHLNRDKDEGLPKMDEVRLEKEIVSLLLVLRALIEEAK